MDLVRIEEKNGEPVAVLEKTVTEEKPVSREHLEQELSQLEAEIKARDDLIMKAQAEKEDLEERGAIISEYLNKGQEEAPEESSEEAPAEEAVEEAPAEE